MKFIRYFSTIFLLFNSAFAQDNECDIIFLDTNNIKSSLKDATLISFKNDSLKFTGSSELNSVHVNDILSIKYYFESISTKVMLIVAGIGVSLAVVAALLFSGEAGHPGYSISTAGAFKGAFILGIVGGALGVIAGQTEKKTINVHFKNMKISEKRKKISEIMELLLISK